VKVFKTKTGELITTKQFISRWKEGIKNVVNNPTPQERLAGERNGTFISLIGYVACLTVLIIFHDKFFVSWFAYSLMLVFLGSIWTTKVKLSSILSQLRLLKDIDLNSIQSDDIINKVDKVLK
jgi:hypothetical protein